MGKLKSYSETELLSMSLTTLCLPVCLFLLISSLARTYYLTVDSYLGEIAELQYDSPYFLLVAGAVILCLIYLVYKDEHYFSRRNVVIFMLAWCVVLGMGFVYSASRMNAGDAEIISNAAYQMAKGSIEGMQAYFKRYPFRLGLAFFEEFVFRILLFYVPGISRGYCFMALQMLNVFFMALSFYAITAISRLLYNSERTEKLTALFLGFSTPFILSCTSLSGRIPALCFSLLGIWAMLVYLKDGKKSCGLLSIVFPALAQCLKLDSVIILIASLIVLLLEAIRRKHLQIFKLAIFMFVFSTLLTCLPIFVYGLRAGENFYNGDFTVYSAMGFGEEEDRYLHYDGLYSAVSFGSGGDEDSQIENTPFSWMSLQEQWNEPSFRTLFNNRDSLHYRDTGWLYSLLCYDMERLTLTHMNIHQSMMLFGLLLGLLALIKMRNGLMNLPAICLLGGFLFHLLFQARSQHAMKYYMLIVPLVAYGFETLFIYIENRNSVTKGDAKYES